jgi:hypothetical protein
MHEGTVMTISMKEANVWQRLVLLKELILERFQVHAGASCIKNKCYCNTILLPEYSHETILKAFENNKPKGIDFTIYYWDGTQTTYLKEKTKN